MTDGLLVLVAGLLGVAVGLAAGLAFRFSEREQVGRLPTPELEEGVVTVLAALRSAAVVTRRDGRVVRASAAAHAYGLVREERVVHAAVQELLDQVARDGEIRDAELELSRPGGTTALLSVRAAPLGLEHLLLLTEDRTEARRLDAIRRDFIVNASHELKTPVGALGLLAETVTDAADDPEAVRRFAGQIRTESARLTRLIQDILELSRVQVVDSAREMVPVQLAEVVAEAVDRAQTTAESRQIKIVVTGQDVSVWGVPELLVTSVRNLLDNAIAYSEPGTQVAVDTRRSGDVVEVAVSDQGIGIPPAEQARLFERFYRVDPARSRDTGGTGLGLSIVKHVIEDHGGEVTVRSRPGEGSTFTIRLPGGHP